MKTLGILMLFGLCTSIGLRIAAKKTANTDRIRAAQRSVSAFSDAIENGEYSLMAIAQRREGPFFDQLRAYISAQEQGKSETEAAALACENVRSETLHAACMLFFGGLSVCSRKEIRARIGQLLTALSDAERETAEDAKQAKLFRAVGVLCGAALAVLLI